MSQYELNAGREAQSTQSHLEPARRYVRSYLDFILREINPALSRQTLQAKIVSIRAETHDTQTYVLRVPKRWGQFHAGMHLPVIVDVHGKRVHRTYTISSTPEQLSRERTLTFTTKRVPGGIVSNHLYDHVKPGQWIEVGPASGSFTSAAASRSHWLMLAGGSGITPFMSMLQTHLPHLSRTTITLLYFCRSERDVIFGKALKQLAAQYPNFHLHIFFDNQQQHVSAEVITAHCADAAERHAYLCGPQGFMQAATDALTTLGLDSGHISRESFGARLPAAELKDIGGGEVIFAQSGVTVETDGQQTLLELAEAAGLAPKHGCRVGLCHQCKCLKTEGQVADVRDGSLSSLDEEEIQSCITIPKGRVTIKL